MGLLAPQSGCLALNGRLVLEGHPCVSVESALVVPAPLPASKHASKNVGIACSTPVRVLKPSLMPGCPSDRSTARIFLRRGVAVVNFRGSDQARNSAEELYENREGHGGTHTVRAGKSAQFDCSSSSGNLGRPSERGALKGPGTAVQRALCSLLLSAAFLLPGAALAEEFSTSLLPNDALQDPPAKTAPLQHSVARLDGLKEVSSGPDLFLHSEAKSILGSQKEAPTLRGSQKEAPTSGGREIHGANQTGEGIQEPQADQLEDAQKKTVPDSRETNESDLEEWLNPYPSFRLYLPELKPSSAQNKPLVLDQLPVRNCGFAQGLKVPAVFLAQLPNPLQPGLVTADNWRIDPFLLKLSKLQEAGQMSQLLQIPAFFQTHQLNRPLLINIFPAALSETPSLSLGSPTSIAGNGFNHLGSVGSVAGPVHMVSQRPRSTRLANPVFLEHQRAFQRKNRRGKVAVAALPGADQVVNQVVNPGVSQALGDGALNQFAELAAAAAKKAFNPGVLGATAGASLKLFTVCALVVWMQKSGRLPETTPAVLSQVAFRLLIPCFLMSKVAVTLYSDFSPALLAVPVAAIVQILLGAGMGRLAAHFAYQRAPLVPAHFETHQPTQASSMVAASVAIATGQPDVAVALAAPKGVGTAQLGASKEALMTATSAFGNSLTLPLVFLSALLDRAGADKAAGYLALYMVGWSPALWTFGYRIIAGSSDEPDCADESDYEGEGRWQAFLTWLGRVMNPPLYGVMLGLIIGATPLAHLFLPPPTAAAETLANATSIGSLTVLATLTSGVFRPVMEAASLLGTATLAVQTVVLASSLAASIPSRLHSLSAASEPFVQTPTANPNSLTEVLRSGEGLVDPAVAGPSGQLPLKRRGARLKQGPDPANVLDGRAVWVVSGVRLLMLPLVNLFLTLGLMRAHILPADPVCGLVLMAEAAMPSAQNLVLLAQLKAKTRPLAGMVAGLLLRQYALSILPITFWMAIFLSVLGLAT